MIYHDRNAAKSEFMVSGAADNTLRLWQVATGKNVYTWEFPTAIKRVAWSEDDSQIVLVTEQRMGYQGAIRIFNVNRKDPVKRERVLLGITKYVLNTLHPPLRNGRTCRILQSCWLKGNCLRFCSQPKAYLNRPRIRQSRALGLEEWR